MGAAVSDSNMPVLYRNIMDGLPNQLARDAFLWFSDKFPGDPMLYRAEQAAREVADSVAFSLPLFERSAEICRQQGIAVADDVPTKVMNFALIRHANWRTGGNRRPTYVGAI